MSATTKIPALNRRKTWMSLISAPAREMPVWSSFLLDYGDKIKDIFLCNSSGRHSETGLAPLNVLVFCCGHTEPLSYAAYTPIYQT